MFDYIYEWMQNLAFYMIIMTAVLQAVPNQNYRKYIRFFSGIVLIILLTAPVLKLFGVEENFKNLYEKAVTEQEVRERAATEELERIYLELQ